MISNAIYLEYRKKRKKLKLKKTYTKKHRIILILISLSNIIFFALPLSFGIKFKIVYLIAISVVSFIFLILTRVLLGEKWNIADYEMRDDKLIELANNIIIDAINKLRNNSKIVIEDTKVFLDFMIDYVINYDEDEQKKNELIVKVLSSISFPIILGIVYPMLNQLSIEYLALILIISIFGSLLLILIISIFYDIFFTTGKQYYYRREFLQILKILKSSKYNSGAKYIRTNKLIMYLKENTTISVVQAVELLELSNSMTRNLLNELVKNKILIRCKKGNKYYYSLLETKNDIKIENIV